MKRGFQQWDEELNKIKNKVKRTAGKQLKKKTQAKMNTIMKEITKELLAIEDEQLKKIKSKIWRKKYETQMERHIWKQNRNNVTTNKSKPAVTI